MAGPVKPIVVDANLMVALVIALPYSERAAELVEGWKLGKVPLYAPLLWEYELTTALRKVVALGAFLEEQAPAALEHLLSLGVQCIPPEPTLHREALHWASQLGQMAAYDAQYLAVAAHLGADFWTADRRLAAKAREANLDWVHWVGTAPG